MTEEDGVGRKLLHRGVVGARGRVTGQHIWGAVRSIRVDSGELTITLYAMIDTLEIQLWADGPAGGLVGRGARGTPFGVSANLPTAALLDPAGHLREGAKYVAPGGTEVSYRDGLLAVTVKEALTAPSLICCEHTFQRTTSLTVQTAPDLSRVGELHVRATSTPRVVVLPLNVAAWKMPFPRTFVETDATLLIGPPGRPQRAPSPRADPAGCCPA